MVNALAQLNNLTLVTRVYIQRKLKCWTRIFYYKIDEKLSNFILLSLVTCGYVSRLACTIPRSLELEAYLGIFN